MGFAYCKYMAQPAELPHKLSFFSPAQKETLALINKVTASSASSFYLIGAGQYLLQIVLLPYSSIPGHYRMRLIAVKCYRKDHHQTVFGLFSHQWARWIPHERHGSAWMWFPKESESSKPTPSTCSFKCVFLWGQRKCAWDNWNAFGIIQIWIQILYSLSPD